jgi:hypothetical protein
MKFMPSQVSHSLSFSFFRFTYLSGSLTHSLTLACIRTYKRSILAKGENIFLFFRITGSMNCFLLRYNHRRRERAEKERSHKTGFQVHLFLRCMQKMRNMLSRPKNNCSNLSLQQAASITTTTTNRHVAFTFKNFLLSRKKNILHSASFHKWTSPRKQCSIKEKFMVQLMAVLKSVSV